MAMKIRNFEDVFPIENGSNVILVFRRVEFLLEKLSLQKSSPPPVFLQRPLTGGGGGGTKRCRCLRSWGPIFQIEPQGSHPFSLWIFAFTLSELTYSLKIDPWKRRFLLETTNFRGELLVFGGVVSEKLEISHDGLL